MARQGRRFDNLQQYDDTMRVWNNYGVGCFIASILGVLAYFGLIFFGAMAGALGDLK